MRTARARVSGKSGDLSLDNVISFQKMVSYSPEKVKYGDFAIGMRSFYSQPHLDRWPIFAGLSGFLAKETAAMAKQHPSVTRVSGESHPPVN